MKQKILLTLVLFSLFLISIVSSQSAFAIECTVDSDCYPEGFTLGKCGTFYTCSGGKCYQGSAHCPPEIFKQPCNATNPCSEGLECFSFPGIGLRCAQPNPCSYFKCPEGTRCVVAETYPVQVICSCVGPECPATSGEEDTVEYDLLTQTVIHTIDQNGQTVSHNISLWKATPGNKGILETNVASAEYSGELIVDESKLFMEISVGKKPINFLPEDVIGISETPNKDLVKKIELKEESQKPVYSVKGIKQARILFIIPVSMEIETNIDAETGDVISVNKPWWGFLAW